MQADLWNTPAGKRVREACWRRDRAAGAPCHICVEEGRDGTIDYSLGPYTRGGDTRAWSPDHLRPRRHWPQLALDPSNIAAAHFSCNASRRDKAAVRPLGRRTRDW
ncbi:MAG: hypothetical protein Q4B54_13335 [Coriobacteriales bacterium]|nr:hypothetical protein [Coriobacteriales bacterium]